MKELSKKKITENATITQAGKGKNYSDYKFKRIFLKS